jgi:hypothetical protein
MLEKINACNSIDEVADLLREETSKELLEAGGNKIESLTNK